MLTDFRRNALVLLVLLMSAAAAGCSVAGTLAPSASSGTPDPGASDAPPIDEPAGETPGPIDYPPDNMWSFLATTPDLQPFAGSLAEAVAASEVVVTGRFVGVERGESHGAPGLEGTSWSAVALIEPDATAKGQPQISHDGYIRVPFILRIGGEDYPEKEFRDLERSIPADPALLFLYSWATYFETTETVVPDRLAALNDRGVYRAIGGDGFMRIVDGRLEPPAYMEGWPRELAGADLAAILDAIRELTKSGG